MINSISSGDPVGIVSSTLMLFPATAPFGIALSIANLVFSLFEDQPEIPPPWGNGRFIWNGNGISTEATGETGGDQAVSNVMNSVLASMNALIERERQQNPGSALGIIPTRMPGVAEDTNGFRYTDIDPLTGAEKHHALRFDTSGRPYNATPGSPESFQSITEGIVRSALARGAIAPMWEVETAKRQTDAGDPKGGLSEEERAGRDGQLAAPITGTTQAFRPVMLDLDGDGLEVTDKAAGVNFNVDDSGYLKKTAWVKPDDGFLVLDRNLNGQIDSGKELFNNGTVALSRRGLAGMAWVDSNYDQKLTAADPVWNELKVWQDTNQNGVQDTGETKTSRACLRSVGGRASTLSGWAARRGAQPIAKLLVSSATQQTAREGACPSGWGEIGRLRRPCPCMGMSPCSVPGQHTHPDCTPTRPPTDRKQALCPLGITELNYAMGTFTRNGVQKQLASPDLEADKDGTRTTVIPEGILVQASADGHMSLLVSRIDDLTALEANRDGITDFEDIETIVSGTSLLANDTLGGFAGSNLTVTGVSNFKHSTGFLDANGRYQKRSFSRPSLKGCRPKKLSKMAQKQAFEGIGWSGKALEVVQFH